MLSSTMVSVLAPHRSARLRRNKRGGVGAAHSEPGQETQESGQEEDGGILKMHTSDDLNSVQQQQCLETQDQHAGERGFILRSQAHESAPSLGHSRVRTGWMTERGLTSGKLDIPTKSPVVKSISQDVSWGRLDNRGVEGGVFTRVAPIPSPVAPIPTRISSRSLDLQAHRRMSQASGQGHQMELSSKPTTSSLLLSLRRFNSNWRNASAGSVDSERKAPSMSWSTNDRPMEMSRLPLFSNSPDDRDRDRLKSLHFSTRAPTYRTTERPQPLPSPNHREADISRAHLFVTSPNYKDPEGVLLSNPQTSRAYPTPNLFRKHTFLSSRLERLSASERPEVNETTGPVRQTVLPSPPPPSTGLVRQTVLPSSVKRTTLTSTSWRKHVPREDSVYDATFPLSPTTTNVNNNKTSIPPGPPSTNYNKSFSLQNANNRKNNNVSSLDTPRNLNITSSHTQVTAKSQNSWSTLKALDALILNDRLRQSPQNPKTHTNTPETRNTSSSLSGDRLHSSFRSHSDTTSMTQPPRNTSISPSVTVSSHNSIERSSPNPNLRPLISKAISTPTPFVRSHCPARYTLSSFSNPTHTPQPLSSQTTHTQNTTPQPPLPDNTYSIFPTPNSTPSNISLTPNTHPLSPASSPPLGDRTFTSSPPLPNNTYSIFPTPNSTPPNISLTPSAHPLSPASSPPLGDRTFTRSLDLSPKKYCTLVDGRAVKQAWQASQEQQQQLSETTSRGQCESPLDANSPLSPSRPLRVIGSPSIFTSLRSGSPTSALSPLPSRISRLHVWRTEETHCPILKSDSTDKSVKEEAKILSSGLDHNARFRFDHKATDSATPEPQRSLTEGTTACRTASPPPPLSDFGNCKRPCFSSPPYSILKSKRPTSPLASPQTQGSDPASPQTQRSAPTSPLTSHPTLGCSPLISPLTSPQNHGSPPTSPLTSHPTLGWSLPISPLISRPPLPRRASSQESSKVIVKETDSVNNTIGQPIDSVEIRPKPLPTRVNIVETLEISSDDSSATPDRNRPIKSTLSPPFLNTQVTLENKFNNRLSDLTPDPSQPTQHRKVIKNPSCQSLWKSNDRSAFDNQRPPTAHAKMNMERKTEREECKRESFPVSETKSLMSPRQTEGPKRGPFALRGEGESVVDTSSTDLTGDPGTPSPELTKKEAEKGQKVSKRMDLILSRLRQTFSAKRFDEDLLTPWRKKRTPQPPSVSGVSDVTECSERGEEERERDSWKENKYILKPRGQENKKQGDHISLSFKVSVKGEKSQFEVLRDANASKNGKQPRFTDLSPTRHHQLDVYTDERVDKPRNQPPQRELNSAWRQPRDPNRSATLPASKASLPSSRSSLSLLSPLDNGDRNNDSVFRSPQLRRKTISLCEPGEVGRGREGRSGFGFGGGQRCSDGRLASYSSCADLKYGIGAGRSFSVSSVQSSHPSGPGRISSALRVNSVNDLTDPIMGFREVTIWGDQTVKGDWTTPTNNHSHTPTRQKSKGDIRARDEWSVISDQTSRNVRKTVAGETDMANSKSRDKYVTVSDRTTSANLSGSSRPKFITWSPEVSDPSPTADRLWSPGIQDTSHFLWDTLTPPPSPPWSPTTKRMSRPPSSSPSRSPALSPSRSPSSTGSRGSQDSLSPRGRLPSKTYVASLAAFEESDTGSDTTTDDEYYLEGGDADDKETEL